MSHPDAMIALLSGKSEITAHFANPPFQYQELERGMKLVLDSYKVLGGRATSSLLVGSMRFSERNPRATQAVAQALDQAAQWIGDHPSDAAALYITKTRSREDPAFVLKQLRDPEISFSVVPERLWTYADFMHSTGVVKTKASDWTELTFANLHDRKGS
jgi:NitT/TauT family transport system substrate-binding protein